MRFYFALFLATRFSVTRLLATGFLSTGLLISVALGQPTSHIKPGMPDLDQRKPSRASGGNFHCTPTAAANSLQWFDDQGMNTVDGDPNDLVDDLADNFLGTNGGTWTDDLVKGLRKYLSGRFLQTGKLWDVKFQGNTWNRGYSVGQVATSPTTAWIKSELADDEDVLLNVQWYTETSPGNYTPGGGHTITASGYLGDDLLISDPWYPELIVEPISVPGIPGPAYHYSTDPGQPNLIAVIREAVSVSPKDFLTLDGLLDLFEYVEPPPIPTCTSCLYKTDYIDYLSLGVDFKDVLQPLTPGDEVTIDLLPPDALPEAGLRVVFNGDGLLEVLQWDPVLQEFALSLPAEMVQLDSELGLSPDDPGLPPHLQSELFINKEALGDFAVDSFFDITYEIKFDGVPGPAGLLGEQLLSDQQVTLDPEPWIPSIPELYPNPNPPLFDPIEESLRQLVEEEIFAMAADFNGDGVIDAADYTVWRDTLGSQVWSGEGADANFDGIVDGLDYIEWRNRYGQIVGLPLASDTIPEPASALLLATGLLGLVFRRTSSPC